MSPILPTRTGVAWLAALLMTVAIAILAGISMGGRVGPGPVADEGSAHGEDAASVELGAAEATVASRAMDRLHLFRTGNAGQEFVLRAEEITAVLRHSVPGLIPAGVSEPVVTLDDGRVRVTGRVAADAFPGTPFLAPLLEALPDTLVVEVRGTVVRDHGGLAFRIDRVLAQRVPIPGSVVTSVVASLSGAGPDRSVNGGLDGRDAGGATIRIAWPAGISSLHVSGDRLVLERADTMLEGAVDGSGGQ